MLSSADRNALPKNKVYTIKLEDGKLVTYLVLPDGRLVKLTNDEFADMLLA